MTSDSVVKLSVNGLEQQVLCPPQETLLETLRERLRLTGTKHGCELGECGACTVLVNGRPVLSCLVLTAAAQQRDILTIESVAHNGRPHPIQSAIADAGAAQCGYCIPGIVLTTKALLDINSSPTRTEIREAIAGNICRCTGYVKTVDAIEMAAAKLRDGAVN
ncbi:MAG: (2Fe-2S)-binding protein [Anaerolineales bacterium]|jgi:carbon-monoxide dehydrogenase small subunit|nr:(2Fe-2S)-binding protein [Anaerolineales bacterium]HJL69713.1 (2Fe-2S)-binding protein [Anaerolineales bacterium]|tara:strand:+ start:19395 stop:19883 length:489 start_codon:yes stop_codon:yes gene_type:complete